MGIVYRPVFLGVHQRLGLVVAARPIRELVWACRDRATGEFVDAYRGAGMQVASTWPGD